MHSTNIAILNDTLKILAKGYYVTDAGKKVELKLFKQQMMKCQVYLPDQIHEMGKGRDQDVSGEQMAESTNAAEVSCENIDSYSMARERAASRSQRAERAPTLLAGQKEEEQRVLVLNFANPVNPGGGVRRGANAQEEDLCRTSSLLLSLESESARPYYDYNRSLHTYMGSDAVIITPDVEIIRDDKKQLLDETTVVSVMTCAAPMLSDGMEGMTQEQYEQLLYRRIIGMLNVAAFLGYKMLVLGAFGCGAFQNDAHVVSDLFYRALKEFDYAGRKAKDVFQHIDFAVLDHSANRYNYKEFSRNFKVTDFYRKEKEVAAALLEMQEMEVDLDQIRGSLVGGAIGDALGYSVEFWPEKQIFRTFGPNGITSYKLTDGKALISDDTQMTLFTANGLLVGDTRGEMRGIRGMPSQYVKMAYNDWYLTQTKSYREVNSQERYSGGGTSWLLDIPELFKRRAPGKTCLSALNDSASIARGYIEHPQNDSKGSGGIMRVAPLALRYRLGKSYRGTVESLDREAAQIAALTHGHSLGYMPAAVLSHIISGILMYRGSKSLKDIVVEARDAVVNIFAEDSHLEELLRIIQLAIHLSENDADDVANIHRIGEGWVAEETLAIAIYCSLKYSTDFSAAIIAAVNHGGDSDTTGAVTGNIVGALVGYEAIEAKWKKDLELHDVIVEMADDLCHGCIMHEMGYYEEPAWSSKYIDMHRYIDKTSKSAHTFFWKDNEENGCFSNWYLSDFVIDDFKYFCVEQYMMAQKAKLFRDADNYTAILRADTPAECKELGRKVRPFDSAVWKKARYEIVKTASRAKYEQNPKLRQKLLATGESLLAEASPYDQIWGIGMDAKEATSVSSKQWPGQNLLGKILMELREEFRG